MHLGMILLGFVACHSSAQPMLRQMPPPDENLNMYILPVGQGDAHVIQCPAPGGEVSIIDMGSSSNTSNSFWNKDQIRSFLKANGNMVRYNLNLLCVCVCVCVCLCVCKIKCVCVLKSNLYIL